MSKTILTEGDEGVRLIVKDVKTKRSDQTERSPVHVVYGGADRFSADTPRKLGDIALKSLESYAPNFVEFANAMRLDEAVTSNDNNSRRTTKENPSSTFAQTVYQRTIDKLKKEPVEDFRIDFEDGYGFRSDEEEDAHAISASDELAKTFLENKITAFSGLRIKSLAPETYGRAVETLHIFLDTFLKQTDNKLPNNFAVTLPKITDAKEVKELCRFLDKIEKKAGLKKGSINVELMIETPQSIIDKKGRFAPADLVKVAKGRCTSVHFGAYDYTAALGISAEHQHLRHDACTFARQIMLITLSPLGIRLSDSVTIEMPVPIHRGEGLTKTQQDENKRAVHNGWRTHFENVTQSMIAGFYQSWDLHPNQIVARYAAVYSFFLKSKDAQGRRLKGFIEKATQATLTGNTFDDAASAQGLMNYFRRGYDCGALTEDEIFESTGLTVEQLRSSFAELSQLNLR